MTVAVRPVEGAADVEAFLDVPEALYEREPGWAPPFRRIERRKLRPGEHSFHAQGECAFFLARRDGRAVGRILAALDRRRGIGQFGMADAPDDAETFAALFAAAESWLAGRGAGECEGPYDLSINERPGLLVEGNALRPTVQMNFAPAYAAARIEALGYRRIKTLLAYRFDLAALAPRAPAPAAGIDWRAASRRTLRADLDAAAEIFNDGWSRHWGFVPSAPADVAMFHRDCGRLLDPGSILFARRADRPVGVALSVPDFQELAPLYRGRPLWAGDIRAALRLVFGRYRGARLMLIGLRRAEQGKGLGGILLDRAISAWRRAGLALGEVSWVLEENVAMRRLCESRGGARAQAFALYSRALAGR